MSDKSEVPSLLPRPDGFGSSSWYEEGRPFVPRRGLTGSSSLKVAVLAPWWLLPAPPDESGAPEGFAPRAERRACPFGGIVWRWRGYAKRWCSSVRVKLLPHHEAYSHESTQWTMWWTRSLKTSLREIVWERLYSTRAH